MKIPNKNGQSEASLSTADEVAPGDHAEKLCTDACQGGSRLPALQRQSTLTFSTEEASLSN